MENFSSFWVPCSKHQVSSLMVVFREGLRRYCPLWWSCRLSLCSRWIDPTSIRLPAYSVSSWRQCGDLSSFLSLTSFCLLTVGAEDCCCIGSHQSQTHSVGSLWTRDRPVAETSDKKNTHKRQTLMLPAGLEPAIPTVERPQTHTFDRAGCGNYRPQVRRTMRLFLPSDDNYCVYPSVIVTWSLFRNIAGCNRLPTVYPRS
jgi:hypothetical protein